ncbi:DUF2235 domain-containing protein [Rhodococcus sovatensis]|uniref:DUF2235 domain-containing protein n=1 Tax=Rhodococcus sovatensis TaxID=1805840 RepID=A0ABZ2PHL1_9NOCA
MAESLGDTSKRLIVCCDGTWKRSDDRDVSNIEKIARAIDTRPTQGKPIQVVHYTAGVGTGATVMERGLGGALGLGLNISLIGAYRFLALNYLPGDEIFIFGFSRGAYTARSLVGMIDTIGLLTPEGVGKNKLREAISVYRGRAHPGEIDLPAEELVQKFRENCHPFDKVTVEFLGVFDTVGALGIPGITRRKHRFHCVAMPSSIRVHTARQALALHERRRAYTPAVWSQKGKKHDDLKQVWFDGVHSDIGGGYSESKFSDRTLLWMLNEAKLRGMRINDSSIVENLQLCREDPRHNTLTLGHKILNAFSWTREKLRLKSRLTGKFRNGFRVLETTSSNESGDPSIRIADVSRERRTERAEGAVRNPNYNKWVDLLKSRQIPECDRVEPTPEISADGQIVWKLPDPSSRHPEDPLQPMGAPERRP